MKKNALNILLLTVLVLGGCTSQNAENPTEEAATNVPFEIQRGVNISHWLSQSGRRGAERAAYFQQSDVDFIAQAGFDHIRIPIDEEQMWDEAGNKEQEAFSLLHQAINWSKAAGLKVIVDLHILRSHHFNAGFDGKENTLFTSEESQEQFYQCWRDLSAELSGYPNDFLAYELMNEPVADDPEQWNTLVGNCAAVVREKEPYRKIVIGSNRWQSVDTFDALKVPENDPNIILSFHFYIPMMLTHYKASWVNIGEYEGPVHYPGQTVKEEDLAGLPEELANAVRNSGGYFDKAALLEKMAKPLQKARESGLQLYCGEWGCYFKAPKADRLRWYADMRENLESNQVAWTIWDYKGGFGIKNMDTLEPAQALLNTLVPPQ